MNILAIDPGTKTGWAALYKGHIESGTHEFTTARGSSPGLRFLRFRSWLADMFRMTEPDLVVYERPHMRGGYATDLLVGFTTRIQEECADPSRNIECEAVHTATLKKATTGSGRAGKDEMAAVAEERFGKSVEDDNEADALCLLWYAMQEHK